jgi:hypothetical protein
VELRLKPGSWSVTASASGVPPLVDTFMIKSPAGLDCIKKTSMPWTPGPSQGTDAIRGTLSAFSAAGA